MPEDPPAFERFRQAVRRIGGETGDLDARLVGMADEGGGSGGWLVGLSVTSHLRRGVLPAPPVPPDVEPLRFRRWSMAPSELDALLDGLEKGEVRTGKERYIIPPLKHGAFYLHFEGRQESRPDHRWTCRLSNDHERAPSHIFRSEEFDDRLRAAKQPWDGLQEVSKGFLPTGWRSNRLEMYTVVFIEVEASAALDSASIEGGHAEVRLAMAPKAKPADAHVGIIAKPSGAPPGSEHRFRLDGAEAQMGADGFLTFRQRLPGDTRHIQAFASYRGLPIGQAQLTVPSAQAPSVEALVLQHYSDGHKRLLAMLDNPGRNQLDVFVTLVLHGLGLRVAPYGLTPWETADVVAHADDRWTLLVECTTGTPDNGNKLAKLHQRCKELESVLGHPVVPMLATSIASKAITKSDRDAASSEGIAILAREDLEDLAARLDEEDGVEAVHRFLETHGPWHSLARGTPRRKPRRL